MFYRRSPTVKVHIKSKILQKTNKLKKRNCKATANVKNKITSKNALKTEKLNVSIAKSYKCKVNNTKSDEEINCNAFAKQPKPVVNEPESKSIAIVMQKRNEDFQALSSIAPKAQILIEITRNYDKIKEIIEWYEKKQKDVIDVPEFKINHKIIKGDLATKSYRLCITVIRDFEKFCNRHNEYKTQDIVSQALLELIEKYR